MKNQNLFQDLAPQEMKKLGGGSALATIGTAILLSIAYDIISNWDSSVDSFYEGFTEGL